MRYVQSLCRNLHFNFIIIALVFSLTAAHASSSLSNSFSFQGQLTNTSGDAIVGLVVLRIQILNPTSENCLLYQEQQSVNLTASTEGRFAISIGSALGDSKRFSGDPNKSMLEVFSNTKPITGLNCGTYSPAVGDGRALKVTIVSVDGVASGEILSSEMIQSVPFAMVADSVQGKTAADLIQVNTSTSNVSQANVDAIFSDYTKLSNLVSGTSDMYAKSNNQGVSLPQYSGAPAGLTPSNEGQFWYDLSSNALKYWDGGSTQTVMTTATAINGGLITAGTIGGTTAINTSGDLQTSGDVISERLILNDSSGVSSGYVALQTQGNMSNSNYTLTFPANDGNTGEVLATNGAGDLLWMSLPLSLPPDGAAGGSLSGSYPNPSIAAGAVGATELANGAVSYSKIQNISANNKLIGRASAGAGVMEELALGSGLSFTGTTLNVSGAAPTGSAGGSLSGTYPNPTIAAGAIGTTELAASAVTSAKIQDGTIAVADIGTGAVTSTGILDSTITNADIASATITFAKVQNINTGKLVGRSTAGTGSMEELALGSGLSFTSGTLNAAGVTPTGSAGGSLSGTYPNPTIAAGVISTTELATSAVTSAKILDGTIAATDIGAGAVTSTGILDNTISSADIADGAVATIDLADGSVTGQKILDGTITASDLSAALQNGLWTVSGADVYRPSGNVGIGVAPSASDRLHVAGVVRINNGVYMGTTARTVGNGGPQATRPVIMRSFATTDTSSANIFETDEWIVQRDNTSNRFVIYSKLSGTGVTSSFWARSGSNYWSGDSLNTLGTTYPGVHTTIDTGTGRELQIFLGAAYSSVGDFAHIVINRVSTDYYWVGYVITNVNN